MTTGFARSSAPRRFLHGATSAYIKAIPLSMSILHVPPGLHRLSHQASLLQVQNGAVSLVSDRPPPCHRREEPAAGAACLPSGRDADRCGVSPARKRRPRGRRARGPPRRLPQRSPPLPQLVAPPSKPPPPAPPRHTDHAATMEIPSGSVRPRSLSLTVAVSGTTTSYSSLPCSWFPPLWGSLSSSWC